MLDEENIEGEEDGVSGMEGDVKVMLLTTSNIFFLIVKSYKYSLSNNYYCCSSDNTI